MDTDVNIMFKNECNNSNFKCKCTLVVYTEIDLQTSGRCRIKHWNLVQRNTLYLASMAALRHPTILLLGSTATFKIGLQIYLENELKTQKSDYT